MNKKVCVGVPLSTLFEITFTQNSNKIEFEFNLKSSADHSGSSEGRWEYNVPTNSDTELRSANRQ